MRFKVPQNVQREDQILWFITLRQLIIIMITGGISYLLFTSVTKHYHVGQLEMMLMWLPLALGIAFCFLKIKGIPLFRFTLLWLETGMFLPRRRFWQPGVGNYVSLTHQETQAKVAKESAIETKDVSSQRVKNLAQVLDQDPLLQEL